MKFLLALLAALVVFGTAYGRYQFVDTPMDHHDAMLHCEKLGLRLMVTRTTLKIKEVINICRPQRACGRLWLGIGRDPRPNPYVWQYISEANPTQVTQTFWAEGEPNNAKRNEYCVELIVGGDYTSKVNRWNDEDCSQKRKFFCESQ